MNLETKRKQLFKNTGILAIGTILSRILTFFLIPLYTIYLTTEDYGYVDLLQTIAYLLLPIISLELYCAVFRFIIEEKNKLNIDKIICTAFAINAISLILMLIVLFIISFFVSHSNTIVFFLYFVSLLVFTNLQFIIRGYGNNKFFSFISFFNTIVSLILNLIFIVILKYKALYILVAIIISNIISIIIIIIKNPILHVFKKSNISTIYAKKMLLYSLPLIPNEVSWWVVNTSDRIIISKVLSLASNGIYAVANKIPLVYTTIFGVFNTAWVESVSRGINDSNSNEFISDMYIKCFKLFSCICLGIICGMSLTFNFFIDIDYSKSYYHILILTIAIFFNSLSSLIGSILTGYKRTASIGKTTIMGAIINLTINIAFIKIIGLYAASISTLISYVVIFIIRTIEVNKIQKLKYPIRYIPFLLINLVIVSVGYIYKNTLINLIIIIYLLIFSLFVNKELLLDFIPLRKGK